MFSLIGSILSYLNPFSENFFGIKLLELLGDLLKALFVPSDERINGIINVVKEKFAFVDTIKNASNSISTTLSDVESSPKFTMELGATKYTNAQSFTILDFSWYLKFKPYGDLIITGFVYAFFLWRLFISLPNIINGAGGFVQTDYMISDINTYKTTGKGRTHGYGLVLFQPKEKERGGKK